MEEESAALQEVREYRRQRDSGMVGERGRRWKDDGELLLKAVREGEVELVQYLVEEVGVSVEVEGMYGRRPLHAAAWKGHLPVGEYLLLVGGADMEAETTHLERPIHFAVANGHHAFVELLLEQGASVDAENRWGRRPLHLAAGWFRLSAVRCLLQHRAGSIDVNAPDCDGHTALHEAAASDFVSRDEVAEEDALTLVRLLVEEGEADPLLRNKDGERASDRAKDKGFDMVERCLLEAEDMAEMQKQA